jgi:hypothetical protein
MLGQVTAAKQVTPRGLCFLLPSHPCSECVAQARFSRAEEHALPHGCGGREPTPVWVLDRGEATELLPTRCPAPLHR